MQTTPYGLGIMKNLVDDELQHVAAHPSKVVIPGSPARAEPGIQTLFFRRFWIPGRASLARNDGAEVCRQSG
jgi:hypothetical protein